MEVIKTKGECHQFGLVLHNILLSVVNDSDRLLSELREDVQSK